jgi:MoxR-like ATPase
MNKNGRTERTNRFSAGEISSYLLKRLGDRKGPGPYGKRIMKRDASADVPPGKGVRSNAVSEGMLEEKVALLDRLITEKEDLVRQIVSDESMIRGLDESKTGEKLLADLDMIDGRECVDLRSFVSAISPYQGIEDSCGEAKKRLSELKSEIERVLSDSRVRNLYGQKLTSRIDIIRLARTAETLQTLTGKISLARMELLARRNSENAVLTWADKETLSRYAMIEEKSSLAIETLMSRDDVYYETKRKGLLKYRKQLLTDGFVETMNVKNDIMNILSHLRLGVPVLLRGHLGAGKTEMALHVARKYFGCEPEFISGSEESTKYDIYGKTQIGVRPEGQKKKEFRQRMEEYLRMNPETTSEGLREVEKQYYQTIVVKGIATSFFEYGPLVRAIREGKPLIIDEMDGIPHSIIMRLNHVLTRRPGDTLQIQEAGDDAIVVKKGFCVIATGNIKSARYKREELDAAFLSRWWSHDVRYTSQQETYEILVSSLIDGRGNLQLKDRNDMEGLKRLTEAASEIQRIFSGEDLDYLGEGGDIAREIPANLKKTVLSLRHLWNIVHPWKANNFDKPIDAYILSEFIKPAVAEDRIYLVQLCCRFRFFKEWKAREFEIPGLTESKLLAFQGKPTMRETGKV